MHPTSLLLALLRVVSWPEWRHHPLRHATALLAVALGVALAFAVHLINASALDEFGAAARAIDGQPDFTLRAQRDGFGEALYARVATAPQVSTASPLIEIDSYALDTQGERQPLRVLGVDAFAAASLSPGLLPRTAQGADRLALIDPAAAFLNPAAQRLFGGTNRLRVQAGDSLASFDIAGTVAADGPPLAVIDIAGVHSASAGWALSRIDVRLVPGVDRAAVLREPASCRPTCVPRHRTRRPRASQPVARLPRQPRPCSRWSRCSPAPSSSSRCWRCRSRSGAAARAARRARPCRARAARAWCSPNRRCSGSPAARSASRSAALLAAARPARARRRPRRRLFRRRRAARCSRASAAVRLRRARRRRRDGRRLAAGAHGRGASPPAQALRASAPGAAATRRRAWAWPADARAGLALALAAAGLRHSAGRLPVGRLSAGRRHHRLAVGRRASLPGAVAAAARPLLPLLAVERARRARDSADVAVSGVVASLALAVALTVMVAELPRLGRATGSTWCCRPTSTCAHAKQRRRRQRLLLAGFARGGRPRACARVERAAHRRPCCSTRRGRRWRWSRAPIDDPARSRCRSSAGPRRRAGRSAGLCERSAGRSLRRAAGQQRLDLPLARRPRVDVLRRRRLARLCAPAAAPSRSTAPTTSA